MTDGEVVTLREFVETRFDELEKRLDQRTQLLMSANERDKSVLNERLKGMNEFRNALRDQAQQFVDRKELELRLKPLEAFMIETRTRINVAIWGIGALFIVAQVIFHMLWGKL